MAAALTALLWLISSLRCRSLELVSLGCLLSVNLATADAQPAPNEQRLRWEQLPDLPDALGVAGPFVGVHHNTLIVAGGANFARPVWESDKVWHAGIHLLEKTTAGYRWLDGGALPRPLGYGAAVSLPEGVLCLGGNDAARVYSETFLLSWNPVSRRIESTPYPPLPAPCANMQAVVISRKVYAAGGQQGLSLDSAMQNLWMLDLNQQADPAAFRWQELPPCPGPPRAFHILARQHNGYDECLYLLSGRTSRGSEIEFLQDHWEYNPRTGSWRERASIPRCVMGGGGLAFGQSHLLVLSGDDGSLFHQTDALRDSHPGFPRETLAYHTLTDTWSSFGPSPQNQVTTSPVLWNGRIVLASGELRPRVRTPAVWMIEPIPSAGAFASLDYLVLVAYLAAMVLIGVWFSRRNRNTEDYFRGGQQIPWWAAGCSIFATMLSSLTYTGLPAKAFAQDWVYALGNWLIPVVALVGVYIALPFYRRIDATSAYEYLERRFSRTIRWFASASFAVFHIFRMAIVMSLTGLALAVATPLSPAESVLLMGGLSVLYSTLGGVEAVIWTDTAQTVVLLGGLMICLVLLLGGLDAGIGETFSTALAAGKFRMVNWHTDPTSAQLALWVVIIGALGQFIPSYTADQAVVQRYMTTTDERLAARAIWTNAVLSVPATLLVFGIGTGLFAFYREHPTRLDPTLTTDQIFPFFIAREVPTGLAGLLVAGIFAAAQSTISTSINSSATTIVTDFLRPLRCCQSESGYLRAARIISVVAGVSGTGLGLCFVNPEIRSLFDAFMQVIGLFMGVLGGLFVLGVLTRRANARGALVGATVGALTMYSLWRWTPVQGYLYSAVGLVTCVLTGYAFSLLTGGQDRDLTGLTLFTSSPEARSTVQPAAPAAS